MLWARQRKSGIARSGGHEPRAKPRGKSAHWGNAFLPGAYAGVYANIAEMKPDAILGHLKHPHLPKLDQRKQADLLTRLNRQDLQRFGEDQKLESTIQAMEMAFQMQFVPEVFDTFGVGSNCSCMESEFAKGCLIARRLVEKGWMVQLSHSIDGDDIAWDTGHGNIHHHQDLAAACDQGIAALIKDLKYAVY